MKKLIKEIDPNAFVFSSAVTETLGDGNFMKEASIFKNKILNSHENIKINFTYKRYNTKIKALKKKTKYKALKNNK